jgi:ABC-2 type transport system permease protein
MNHILLDLKACLKTFARNKSTIFWTLAFPSVLILIFGAIFSQSTIRNDLYVQNQDLVDGEATYWSDQIISILNKTDAFNIKMVDVSINATDYALENRLDSLLIIPQGFNDSTNLAIATHSDSSISMTLVYDQSSSSSAIVQSIIMGIVERMNFEFSQGQNFLNVEGLTIAPQRFSFIDFFMPGVIGMTAMTTSIFTSVAISSRFKETGVFHKLATTPLKRYEWILSRTIFNILVSYLGMVVMLLIGVLVFNMKITVDAVSLVMVAMASLLFSGIGMIIARFVKDPDGADAAANVVTFPMMFLSGTFFELSQMPQFLQSIAAVLPLTYVSEGLRAAMIFGQADTALFNLMLVSIMGIVSIIVGSWITKWEDS